VASVAPPESIRALDTRGYSLTFRLVFNREGKAMDDSANARCDGCVTSIPLTEWSLTPDGVRGKRNDAAIAITRAALTERRKFVPSSGLTVVLLL
jgi:hypothetical protein